MPLRQPIVAGQFYDADRHACRQHLQVMLADQPPLPADLPTRILAGIVPHAGWVFSGPLAARVFAAIAHRHTAVDTFVLFGAVHSLSSPTPALYHQGQWQTPLGPVPIDEDLADQILADHPYALTADPATHNREHSLEVQVPFIRHLFPDARILPIMVPPTSAAADLGRAVAQTLARRSDATTVCLGSTDLTHYGPSYGFTPQGLGPDALRWAKDTNDRQLLEQILALNPARVVQTAQQNASACGPGAIAATIAAAVELGAERALLLDHTTSAEIMADRFGRESDDAVGYAAIVFG